MLEPEQRWKHFAKLNQMKVAFLVVGFPAAHLIFVVRKINRFDQFWNPKSGAPPLDTFFVSIINRLRTVIYSST